MTIVKEFLDLKKTSEAETELLEHLEKKPLTESQLNNILSADSVEQQARNRKKYGSLIGELRTKGMIVEDKKLSFGDFKKSNPGVMCIRSTTMQQMNANEYKSMREYFKSPSHPYGFDERKYKEMKVYDDLPEESRKVKHYSYFDGTETKKSGGGFMTKRNTLTYPFHDGDERKFNDAKKLYEQSRKEVKSIFDDLGVAV
jgi:hypothetical protein